MRKETAVISLPPLAAHHDHEHHQLVFGFEGDTEFDLHGDRRKIDAGWGCLLPSGTEHAFYGLGENRIVVVNLPTISDDREQQLRIQRLFDEPEYFNCPPNLMLLLRALGHEMLHSVDDPFLQDACANTLICALSRQLDDQRLQPRQQGHLNLQLLNDYIDLHLNRRISVEELAGAVFLSSSQFYYRFRAETGVTPQQHVLERRLDGVRQALVNTDNSLSRITSDFGFGSQSSLTRRFTERYGVPPARYRRRFREG